MLKNQCELFVQNKRDLEKVFKWEMDIMTIAASSIFTSKKQTIDPDRLKECKKILKSKAGMFSDFRGVIELILLCKMAISSNPEEFLDNVQNVYSMLVKGIFSGSSYKVLSAILIVEYTNQYEYYVERTMEIYKRMKEEHKWLTSQEDMPLATILAISNKNIEYLIRDMEESYSILHKYFHSSNAVQSLTHMLCLNEEAPQVKCQQVIDLYEKLKERKHKYGQSYELASLSALLMLDMNLDEIVDEMIEVDEYLKDQKGFGNFILGASHRRMFATQIVLDEHTNVETSNSVLTSSLSIAVTIEICMIVMMASIAATSANNH